MAAIRRPGLAPDDPPVETPNFPKETSLNALIRKHPYERVHVRPLRWTSLQIRLLGCVFVDEEIEDGPANIRMSEHDRIHVHGLTVADEETLENSF